MPYEPHPDDLDPKTIAAGELLIEAAKRLARRPEQIETLKRFVDMWGFDAYDPFDDAGCSENVRTIILLLLRDADFYKLQFQGET